MSVASTTSGLGAETYNKLFPKLTQVQMDRLRHFGLVRDLDADAIVFEQGESHVPFFVLLSGRMAIVQPSAGTERVIVVHEAGEFTGETNMLSGGRTLVRGRMLTPGQVLEIAPAALRAIVQTEPELSDVLMRAFISRRLQLIEFGQGDVVVLGSRHSAATLQIREFLARNGHPFSYLDLERDLDAQQMLERFNICTEDVPVVICRDQYVLRNPSLRDLANCLGLNPDVDHSTLRDVIVIGAGPSGLAAAVYAASEGLNVLVIESSSPGGQAGSSSKIENYLGFPTGISGQELAGRAYTQAQKFGADIVVAQDATSIHCNRQPFTIDLDDGQQIASRTFIIATGARYNKLDVPNLKRFEGNGIYYGATFIEAQLCQGEDVIVIGGGNSAGQAAVFLSQNARKVFMLVRSSGLAQSMSRYLIKRIEENPNIELRTHTEISALEGDGALDRVRLRNRQTGEEEAREIRHVFVMTGASPNTDWLRGCVALDDKGFIKTGRDLTPEELSSKWKLSRPPFLLETNVPGVFAVGDVRSGNVKRVASAVGEGSIAVQMVHQILAEQ
jgi:thioredoxin reductase (NADPH)